MYYRYDFWANGFCNGVFMKRCFTCLSAIWVLIILSPLLPTAVAKGNLPAPNSWAAFQDQKYGATLYYPSNWFSPAQLTRDGFLFASLHEDGAKLFLKTEFDELRTGAAEVVAKLKSGTGAHRITDIQLGDNWYEMRLTPSPSMQQVSRVSFSCKERIISAVTLIYPIANAVAYEAMFAKLKRRFSVGIGAETPVRACS